MSYLSNHTAITITKFFFLENEHTQPTMLPLIQTLQ